MEDKGHAAHKFDLSGCKAGDVFLGCPVCWWRLSPGEAAKPECPECRERLRMYTVTPDDILTPNDRLHGRGRSESE